MPDEFRLTKRTNITRLYGWGTWTWRASPKPASRPSSLHSAAVSGKSQVMTWYQTWSHSAHLRDLGGGDRRAIGGGLRQGKITMLER
jgi:hypothetical protein